MKALVYFIVSLRFFSACCPNQSAGCDSVISFVGHLHITQFLDSQQFTHELQNRSSYEFRTLQNMTCEFISNSILASIDDIIMCSCYVTNCTEDFNATINCRYRIDITDNVRSSTRITADELQEVILDGSDYVTVDGIQVNRTAFSVLEPFQCTADLDCKNFGHCKLNPTDLLWYCQCVYGFVGDKCEIPPPMVGYPKPDVAGMVAGIVVYLIAMSILFSVITALTVDEDDLYRAGYSEDFRII